MSILIKNATIVTQNEKREILEGDILIQGNEIAEVGKVDEKTDSVIDASGKMAIPGFVNTHTHISMTVFRGYGEGLPLHDWLNKKIWPAEAKLTAEEVYWGTLLGACEMIRSGTTCYSDMYIVHTDEIAKATEKIGLRALIPRAMFDLLPGRDAKKELKEAVEFAERWNKHHLVKPCISAHAPFTCSEELLVKAKEEANRKNLKFHMHVSETRKEVFDILKEKKKRPFEYLNSIGLVDEHSLFAHAGWVTKREIGIVGKNKASISSCPVSNLKLATGGICQLTEYDELGANVTLGTDGAASNNSLDMFETMKMASLLQKHHYWKANILSAQKIFDFATINGAKALGFNNGSIEKGKLADIVLLDKNAPNMVPFHDVLANLVYSANPSNVADVIINGKIVMENKKIENEGKIIEKVKELTRNYL